MSGCDEGVGALMLWAQHRLAACGIAQPRREARLLMAHALGLDAGAWMPHHENVSVQPIVAAAFRVMIGRRAGREPLAHITGAQGFWTLELAVSAATLIPRADSETLIESLLAFRPDRNRPLRMLDLGTGSGCLLLAALSEYPVGWGIGVDRSQAACALAVANARMAGLAGRSAFLCSSWSDALAPGARGFDLVLSNPPYVASGDIGGLMPEVGRFEPRVALDGGADGLDAYRSILGGLDGLLAEDGLAILEIGAGQLEDLRGLAEMLGLEVLSARADLGGVPRAVALRRGPNRARRK